MESLPRMMRTASVVVVCALAALQAFLPPATVNLVAAVAILVFGIPHGALDRATVQGPQRVSLHAMWSSLRFFIAYSTLAAAFAAFWHVAAPWALPVFLILSVIHFGTGDISGGPAWWRGLQLVSHGGAVVVLIPTFHPEQASEIFGFLSDPTTATSIVVTLDAILPVWSAIATLYVSLALWTGRHRKRAAETALVAAGCIVLPPMLGFLLYFTVFHGPRHLRRVLRDLRMAGVAPSAVLIEAGAITAVSLIVFAAVLSLGADWLSEETVLRNLFIYLAALTIPHMLLIDLFPVVASTRISHRPAMPYQSTR